VALPALQERSGYRRVLDIGCGQGRIGIHLARAGFQVTGFDVVSSVLAEFRRRARSLGVLDHVHLFELDMKQSWPLRDAGVDCVFAVTVTDNLTTRAEEEHFRAELRRVLRTCGLLVVRFYLPSDGYYGPLLAASPRRREGILTDPNNGIVFRIHTPEEMRRLLGPSFVPQVNREWISRDRKYGRIYARKSQIMVFEKRSETEGA